MNTQDKVILITGGRRVGGAMAKAFVPLGMRTAMTYHTSRVAIEATLAEVRSAGREGLAVAADLTRPDQAARAVAETVAAFGRLDVLVNMTSVYKRTPFESLEPADFDAMISANLAAPYHTAVAAAKQMLTQPIEDGLKGKIVNVGDWATDRPYKDYLPYLVAKGALKTMTLALAGELAPHVTVNLIQPAMIEPPPDLSEAEHAAVLAATPLGRSGYPADLFNLVAYLLAGTDYATGSCFRVDGGRFLGEGEG